MLLEWVLEKGIIEEILDNMKTFTFRIYKITSSSFA